MASGDATVQAMDDMYNRLHWEIVKLKRKMSRLTQIVERAETAGGIVAYALASAPTNNIGGMSDGIANIDIAWITNGRKSGEGAGAGTGVLAIFDASQDLWLRLTDYTAVLT
jgi:hypothetical protein